MRWIWRRRQEERDPYAQLRERLERQAVVLNGFMIDAVPPECPECDSAVSFAQETPTHLGWIVTFMPCRHSRPASLALVDTLRAEASQRYQWRKS